MSPSPIVIVGAGHAGVQAAASLREEGYDGEDHPALRREGSSLSAPAAVESVPQGRDGHPRPAPEGRSHYRDQRIDLRLGVGARGSTGRRSGSRLSDGGRSATGISSWRPERGDASSMRPASNCPACSSSATSPTRPGSASGLARSKDRYDRRWIHRARDRRDRRRGWGRGDSRRDRPAHGPGGLAILSDFFLKAHGAFGAKFRLGRGVAEIRGRARPKRSCSPTARSSPRTS